jgi:hypothetical protein
MKTYEQKSDVTHNRNIELYTDEQIEIMKTEMKEFIYFFGYAANHSEADSKTKFFSYADTEESEENFF